MKSGIIYVHGKGGSAEEAAHYRALFPETELIGFDYQARTPWDARREFPRFFAGHRRSCEHWFHTEEQMRFLDDWIAGGLQKRNR